MSPYRAGHGNEPRAEGEQDGLVNELIQQFADPLAFYRELIQNSIDAEATQVAVTVTFEHDGGAEGDALGRLEVSVRDDGCGMSRAVLEEQLTVLFRSGKEDQTDKIGKFGVGFVSVLAVEPALVSVRTTEGAGEQWTLELGADQTYELFRAEGGGGSGTTVTLRLERVESEFRAFVKGSERALVKWCRHAEIPIRFVASFLGDELIRETRIDTPLGVDALVSVRVEDSGTTVVAGLPADGSSYLGFFNRGLLLHETSQGVLGRVVVSVQDGRLEHTLSRDNVRRDEHHARAMSMASRVIDRELTREVHDVLRELAGGAVSDVSIEAVLTAARNAGLTLDEGAIQIPLIEASRGQRTVRLRDLRKGEVYFASEADELTAAVAERGAAIVDLSRARYLAAYVQVLEAYASRTIDSVHTQFTLAAPIEASGADLVLMDQVGELIGALVRQPNGPTLARFSGARASALQLAGGDGELPLALDAEMASANPFRMLMRPAWLFNAEHPSVLAARRLAVTEPAIAATLLTRVLLSERGRLGPDEDEAWLEAASEAVAR